MDEIKCPKGHGAMTKSKIEKLIPFKGIRLNIVEDAYICPICKLTAGSIQTAAKVQRVISEEYRKQTGLLTGEEIKYLRTEKGMTQADLAGLMNVGIASVKRWETGSIQSKSMDYALRMQLQCKLGVHDYTGDREISLSRIKLVIKQLESLVGKKLLKKGDKFLYLAKYLWYSDFLSFKELNRSMTGASYAAITYGPQLNNYRELIDPIKDSNEKEAEPLTDSEIIILEKITSQFPEEEMVYDAAHRELVWKETAVGALIPYEKAYQLTEV